MVGLTLTSKQKSVCPLPGHHRVSGLSWGVGQTLFCLMLRFDHDVFSQVFV